MLLTAQVIASQPTKITLQVDNRDNYRAWIEAVVELFEEEYPNIEVDIWAPTGNLLEAIIVSIAGGIPPDIGLHDPYAVIDFARNGLLEDLTPYIERDREHFTDWFQPAMEMTSFEGGVYALPRDLQVYGVYYNADAYNESGLSNPDEQWTYNDFLNNTRSLLKTDGQNPVRHGFVFPRWRSWVIPMWAHGGDFVDSWRNPTHFTGRSEETIQGLEYLQELMASGAVLDQSSQSFELNSFIQQRAGMTMSTTIDMNGYAEIENFTWDVAPMPIGPAGRVSVISALGWFMMKDSLNKDEAWTLMRYITSPKALGMLVDMIGVIPPNREVLFENWLTSVNMPTNRHFFLTGIEVARPSIGALPLSIYNPIGEESLAIIRGQKSLSAGLEDMERKINAAIADLLD